MPTGDDATRRRTDLACEWCGAALRGSLTVPVDKWAAVGCYECVRSWRGAVDGPSPTGKPNTLQVLHVFV